MEELTRATNELDKALKLNLEALIEYALLFAKPKIKGEITKGKMRWRGIKLVHQLPSRGEKEYYCVTQRGIELVPKLFIEIKISIERKTFGFTMSYDPKILNQIRGSR